MRNSNDSRVLDCIAICCKLLNRPIKPSEICEILRLMPASVSRVTRRLLANKQIKKTTKPLGFVIAEDTEK